MVLQHNAVKEKGGVDGRRKTGVLGAETRQQAKITRDRYLTNERELANISHTELCTPREVSQPGDGKSR